MLRIPGQAGNDFCDKGLRPTRRDLLRVGGASMLGLSLGSMFELQAMANTTAGGPGWGKAKSIILVYLQGGPTSGSTAGRNR